MARCALRQASAPEVQSSHDGAAHIKGPHASRFCRNICRAAWGAVIENRFSSKLRIASGLDATPASGNGRVASSWPTVQRCRWHSDDTSNGLHACMEHGVLAVGRHYSIFR